MFRRLIVEEWQTTLTIISFTLFLLVFTLKTVGAWLMSRGSVEHMQNLPLQEDLTHD